MQHTTLLAALLASAATAVLGAPAQPGSSNQTAPPQQHVDADLPADVPANPRGNDKALLDALTLAPTAKERLALLDRPGDMKYDFLAPPEGATTKGAGGRTVVADRALFPALLGNGGSLTMGFIDACGFNTPHVHPRGTELNLVVEGRLVSEMLLENGQAATAQNLLNKYQMTVFPQGALHTEFNPDCEPAVFVAGFPSEDPGVQSEAQAFFGLRPDVVKAALGLDAVAGEDLESFRDRIPRNVALGVESCLKKCGIKKAPKRDLSAAAAAAAV